MDWAEPSTSDIPAPVPVCLPTKPICLVVEKVCAMLSPMQKGEQISPSSGKKLRFLARQQARDENKMDILEADVHTPENSWAISQECCQGKKRIKFLFLTFLLMETMLAYLSTLLVEMSIMTGKSVTKVNEKTILGVPSITTLHTRVQYEVKKYNLSR